MKKNGQLQMEAIICFAVFLGVLGAFLGSINEAKGSAEKAAEALEAKALSETCCIAADTVFSAGVSELVLREMPCSAEGSSVEGIVEGHSKKSECLAKGIRLVQSGSKTALEVSLDGHYR